MQDELSTSSSPMSLAIARHGRLVQLALILMIAEILSYFWPKVSGVQVYLLGFTKTI